MTVRFNTSPDYFDFLGSYIEGVPLYQPHKTNFEVVSKEEKEKSEIFEKIENIFEGIKSGAEWCENVSIESLEHLSGSAMKFLEEASGPFQAVYIAKEGKEAVEEALHNGISSKLAQLGCSLVYRLSNFLTSLQTMGFLTSFGASLLRLSLVGSVCLALGSAIQLIDNIVHFKGFTPLGLALLATIGACLLLYVAWQGSLAIKILALLLFSSKIILSATTGIYA